MKSFKCNGLHFLLLLTLTLSTLCSNLLTYALPAPQIKIHYKLNASGPQISYSFFVENTGTANFPLKDLKVRYWYTIDSASEQLSTFHTNNTSNRLLARFVTVPGYQHADSYFEIDFKNYTDVMLPPNSKSFTVDVTFKKIDGSSYIQSNDYSLDTNANGQFIVSEKLTAYLNSVELCYGKEPNFAAGSDYVAMIYAKENFAGNIASLKVAKYTTQNLKSLGINDNEINSILVKKDYRVLLYKDDQFQGPYLERTINDPSFVNNNFANMISSIILVKIGDSLESVPNYDASMDVRPTLTDTVTPTPKRNTSGIPSDLAIRLSTDKMKYQSGQTIDYVIEYKNAYHLATGEVIIRAEIPANTSLLDAAGGTVQGNTIQWKFSKLDPLSHSRIVYRVRVNDLNQAEVMVTNQANILNLSDTVENISDDTSSIKVLLFSTSGKAASFGSNFHSAYVVGYPDASFRPDKEVTRAEVATIFAKISGMSPPAVQHSTFSDVPPSHWAFGNIALATTQLGLFNGYPDGSFKPNAPMTRAEIAIVASKYLKANHVHPFTLHFSDIEQHWAKNFIEEAYRYQLVKGYVDGSFKPNHNVKRAELVTIINKMLYRGPLFSITPRFPDVKVDHWAFGQVEEAAGAHRYIRDSNGNEIAVD